MTFLTSSLKIQLILILLSVLSVSCNLAVAQSDKQTMGDVQRAREMARQKGDYAQHIQPVDESQKYHGVYYGYLPCKDCAGIKMTLSLKNKRNYLLVTQHAQASTREFYEKGKYTWDDKNHIVTLVNRNDSSVRKFRIKNDSALIQLTSEGEVMQGNRDEYILLRSDKNKSREVHMH